MVLTHGKLSFGNQSYYLKECTDYYLSQEEGAGWWYGEGSKLLGLSGKVKRKQLSNLYRGKSPVDGKPLVQNANKREGKRKRRPGSDYTFSDPKDVSILIALSSLAVMQTVFLCRDIAFEAVVKKLEQDIGYCRIGRDGTKRVRAKIIIARFVEFVSRSFDMDWHDHSLIFNVGVCPDGKTRALDTRLLYKPGYIKKLEAYRLKILAEELQKRLPIKCIQTPHGFRIEGFSQSIKDRFSRRSKAIERMIQAKGLVDPKEIDRAKKENKPFKKSTPPLCVLRDIWQKRSREYGFDIDQVFQHHKEITPLPQKQSSIQLERTTESSKQKTVLIQPDRSEKKQTRRSHEIDDQSNIDNRHISPGQHAEPESPNTPTRSDPPPNRSTPLSVPVRRLNNVVDRIQRRTSLFETSSLYINQAIRKYSKPRSALEAEIDYHVGQFKKALNHKKTKKIDRDLVKRQARQYLDKNEAELVRGIVSNHGPLQVVNISDLSSENKVLKVCNEIWEKANMDVWGFSSSRSGTTVMQEETGIRTRTFRAFELMRSPTLKYRVKYTIKQLVTQAILSRSYPLRPFNTEKKVLVVNQAHWLNMDQMNELLQAVHKCGGRIVLLGSTDLREERFTAFDHVAYRTSRNDSLHVRKDYLSLIPKPTLTPENERKEP